MKQFGDFEPEYTDPVKSAIVILPIPYDGTSTYMKGADMGPEAIVEASYNLEFYDIETDSEIYKHGIYVADPVTEDTSPEAMAQVGYKVAKEWLAKGKFLVTLGGEHSISYGPIRAHSEKYEDLTILQIDAHADMRETYLGSPHNHACIMARAKEFAPVIQVGIRSMSIEEKVNIKPGRVFWAHQVHRDPDWINKLIPLLTKNTYITIDLDGFDPALLPSTGTPEPGGVTWTQVFDLIWAVYEHSNIVGFDIVELAPNPAAPASDFVAARLLYQMLSVIFHKKPLQ